MSIYCDQTNKIRPFNSTTFIFLLSNTLLFLSTFAYLLFDAETLQEYGFSICGALTALNILMIFLIKIWRMPNILHLIEMCEAFIEKSKSDSNFNEVNK